LPLGKSESTPEPLEELVLVDTDSADTTGDEAGAEVVVGAADVELELGVALVLVLELVNWMNWATSAELEEGVGVGVVDVEVDVEVGVGVVEVAAARTVEILSPTRTYIPAASPASTSSAGITSPWSSKIVTIGPGTVVVVEAPRGSMEVPCLAAWRCIWLWGWATTRVAAPTSARRENFIVKKRIREVWILKYWRKSLGDLLAMNLVVNK
jgi:hypothetical protein